MNEATLDSQLDLCLFDVRLGSMCSEQMNEQTKKKKETRSNEINMISEQQPCTYTIFE